MKNVITFIGFLMLMVGGCGVMNEAGNIQPVALIMAIAGAVVLLIVTRGYRNVF